MSLPEKQIYRFGDVEVDASRQNYVKRGEKQYYLRPQTYQVLLCLLEQRGRDVRKEDLIQNVWKGTAVGDNSIARCVTEIRKVLGDDSEDPRFIKTVPKVGYRFIGHIEEAYPNGTAIITTEESTTIQLEVKHGFNSKNLIAFALSLLLLTAGAAYFYARSNRTRSEPETDAVLPHLPGKRALAVMYFENQSESAELDWLREGLADMLITNLSRSKNLTVLNRQRLHSLLERSKYGLEDKISLDLALGIARRSRADTVVLGNFARFGEKLRINVHLYDAQTGQALQSESLNIDRLEQIPMQVDLLSIKIASHLGARPTEQERAQGLSEIMTNNLEAFRYYSLALEKAQGFHSTEALALLKKAVALDPQFAMAYARIGYIHAMIRNGEGEQAKPYLEKAFQLSHRLNEKDKLYVTAWYAQANIDYDSAIRAFRQITQQYPLETEAYWRLGFQLQQAGRFEEAADAYQQGLAIDPEAKDIYNKLGFIYSNLGRYDEAIVAHRRYVELAPDEPNAYDSLGITLTEAGYYEAALKELARALELNPKFHFASLHTADIYFRLGRYRAAQAEYERFLDLAPSDWDRGVGYNRLVLLHLQKGQMSEAAAAAREEFKHQKDLGGPMLVALAHNDFSAAARWKTRLFESPTYAWPNTSYGAQLRAYLLGIYELKRGHTHEAIELLGEASYRPPLLWTVGSVVDSLANAYLELGRFDEAIAEYERLLSLNPNYPLARYHLAQAYERKGEREKALAEYYRFLQIWKDADPNLPEMVSARKISSASPQLSVASLD